SAPDPGRGRALERQPRELAHRALGPRRALLVDAPRALPPPTAMATTVRRRRAVRAAALGRGGEGLAGGTEWLALLEVGSRRGNDSSGPAPLHGRRRGRRTDRARSVRAPRRVRARPAGPAADGVPWAAEAEATTGDAGSRGARVYRPRTGRGGIQGEAGDPPLPGQHGAAGPGSRVGGRRGVRRRREPRVERGGGRR